MTATVAAAAALAAAAAAQSAAANALHMTSRASGAARDAPVGPLAPRPFATTQPPPIESLGFQYFTPLMTPLPVVTRLPQPAPNQETVNTFLRLQSGGGNQMADGLLWNMTLILHSYAPNEQESTAEINMSIALAWGGNAQGTTIPLSNGQSFYITYSRVHMMPHRQGDPNVDLTRYRAGVLWRIAGNGIALPS